jgi:uncharacterized protein (TIGR02246 family)
MTRSSCAALLLGLSALVACTPAAPPTPPPPTKPDPATVRTALEGEMSKMIPAFAAKDGATFASFFTDDATWILPDATTYVGRPAIEKGAKVFIESFASASLGAVTIDKVIVASETEAVTFSHGSMTITMKGKKTAELHNNPFADYWVKGADGMWRIAYEVNAEGVTPAAAAKK